MNKYNVTYNGNVIGSTYAESASKAINNVWWRVCKQYHAYTNTWQKKDLRAVKVA